MDLLDRFGLTLSEYQAIRLCSKRDAHDDAIWDIQAHPASNHMMSVGADTSVRIWSIDESTFPVNATTSSIMPSRSNTYEAEA